MGLAADMIAYLTAEGIVATFRDDFEPYAKTGRVVTIVTYGGVSPELTQLVDVRIDQPRFQVACRDHDPAVAEALAIDVQNRLARLQNREIDGTWYLSVLPLQPPFYLKRNDQEGVTYAANYECWKAPHGLN